MGEDKVSFSIFVYFPFSIFHLSFLILHRQGGSQKSTEHGK